MKLPKKAVIGYRTYAIEEYPEREAFANGHLGLADHSSCTIKVRLEGLQGFEVADTLLHELLHVCFRTGDIDLPNEEQVVTVLAHQLVQTMRDNPKVFDFIQAMAGR